MIDPVWPSFNRPGLLRWLPGPPQLMRRSALGSGRIYVQGGHRRKPVNELDAIAKRAKVGWFTGYAPDPVDDPGPEPVPLSESR